MSLNAQVKNNNNNNNNKTFLFERRKVDAWLQTYDEKNREKPFALWAHHEFYFPPKFSVIQLNILKKKKSTKKQLRIEQEWFKRQTEHLDESKREVMVLLARAIILMHHLISAYETALIL